MEQNVDGRKCPECGLVALMPGEPVCWRCMFKNVLEVNRALANRARTQDALCSLARRLNAGEYIDGTMKLNEGVYLIVGHAVLTTSSGEPLLEVRPMFLFSERFLATRCMN